MGKLTDLFDAAWARLDPTPPDVPLSDAAAMVSKAVRAMESEVDKAVPLTRAMAVSAVGNGVSMTLHNLVAIPDDSKHDGRRRRRRRRDHDVPNETGPITIPVGSVHDAVWGALKVLEGSPPPPEPDGPPVPPKVLAVLQELLKANLLDSAELALTVSERVRDLLKKEGVHVVDYDAADPVHRDDWFNFAADVDLANDPGTMTTPALVDAATDRVLCRGLVVATDSAPVSPKGQ